MSASLFKRYILSRRSQFNNNEKANIETAVKETEEVINGDDKAAIDAKAENLAKVSQKLGELIYAQAQAEAGNAGTAEQAAADQAADADVVDAEFEEVKDKKD